MNGLICLLALLQVATEGAAAPAPALEGARPAWVRYFGSPHTDWTNRIVETREGRIVVAGFLNRDDDAEAPDWNAFAQGHDAQGRQIWGRSFGGSGVDAAWTVIERADGKFVFGGISSERAGGDMNAALTITDERSLNPVHRSFGGTGDDRATDLLELSDGSLLLIGQTDSSGAGGIDVFLVKTDRGGRELWRRTYGGKTDDRGFFGAALPDGGAVVAGVTGPRGATIYC